MAKRRVARSRRSLIAMLLIGFVLLTTVVIARRVFGVQQQEVIHGLQRTRDSLEAQRVRLDVAIRDASSRARLQPIAEQRLNMHILKSGQQVFLNRRTSRPSDSATKPSRQPP